MTQPQTMYEKIWARHEILRRDGGPSLLYVDRHIIHDGGFHAFGNLRARGLKVRRPDHTVGTPDHYVSSSGPEATRAAPPEIKRMIDTYERNVAYAGVTSFGLDDPRQGIVHVVGPEQGITQPGIILVCGDSHTATHGALGAFSFGIGQSENAHVLATQTIWQARSKTMRIRVDGVRPKGVSAKDVILGVIGRIGAGGAGGHVVEYAGSVFAGMSIEERLTVCNMSIEAGARSGMVAPDDTTFAYLEGRPYAPEGKEWERAVAYWRTLPSDDDAMFDKEVSIDAADLAPMVTWGTSPETALPITARVPDPADAPDPARREGMIRALDYMGLTPGTALTDIAVDRVFIGSCTNSRIEDLRAAAAVIKDRKAVVPAMVVSGSNQVKVQAEAEGLDSIFKDAGFIWGHAGCSMCVGMNGDLVPPGERCASTSNRNFAGRQGPGSRTHLMSPAMAAAAAVTGRLTDVRQLMGQG